MHRLSRKIFVMLFVFLLFALLVTLPLVSGLSLAGKKLSPVIYKQGSAITNEYTIFGTANPVKVKLDSGIFGGISVTDVADDAFELRISFPEDEYIPPGIHSFALTVEEDVPPSGGISSSVTVSKNFEVIVYSYDKEIQSSLSVPNRNEGSNITADLHVQSMGYPTIEAVYAEIAILSPEGMLLDSAVTETRRLPGLETTAFKVQFDTDSYPAGTYLAEAAVNYDGKTQKNNATFLIGNMDVQLLNYSSVLETGYAQFSAQVKSNWGNPLRDVHAALMLGAVEVVRTPSIILKPWEKGTLSAVAAVDFPPGNYTGELIIFFEGEQKQFPADVEILEREEQPAQPVEEELRQAGRFTLIPLIIAAVLLMAALGWYLWKKTHIEGEW